MGKKRKKKQAAVLQPQPRPRLIKLRTDAGLTQEALAKALGLDKSAVSHWEQGLSFPKRTRQPDVAEQLGVTVVELLEAA